MNNNPHATMTVNVVPSLPDDFATTIERAVAIATSDALIRQGLTQLYSVLGTTPELDAAFDALHVLVHGKEDQ